MPNLILVFQLSFATSEVPGKIESAVQDAEETTKKIEHFSVEQEHLQGDICNHLADVRPMVKTLSALTTQIDHLQIYAKYLQMIGRIEDLRYTNQFRIVLIPVEWVA